MGDNSPNALFYELYGRIVDLQRATLPDVDLLANRWLFMHLIEALDDRLLTLLTKYTDEYVSGAISINFNLDTIFLPKFLTLANRLDRTTRSRIGLEFQLIDVITNLEGFRFARTFLKENGFIVTLNGVNPSASRCSRAATSIVWSIPIRSASTERAPRAAPCARGTTLHPIRTALRLRPDQRP